MAGLENYKNKLALVTGAGDGIGKMLAKGFAAAGMTVCVQDIRAEAAQAVVDEITSDDGGAAFPLAFDISDRAACFAAAEDVRGRGDPLALLWLNAGVGIGAPIIGARQNAVEWAFGVNVLGPIWTAQAFVPLMTEMKEAPSPKHVGVTASSAALRAPDGDFPLYATTKHGTFAVAEAMKGELDAQGIGLTILNPGLLNTEIWDGAKARPNRFGGERRMDPAIATQWREAKHPDLMWPHIERVVGEGGGILTCATDSGETKTEFLVRAGRIADGIVEI